MQGGHFVPVPFREMLDPQTGRAKIRLVDVHSTRYAIARRYMIRLRRDDFDDPHELAKFAATASMSLQQFREEFAPLIESEPPPLQVGVPGHPNPPEAGAPPAMPPDALAEPEGSAAEASAQQAPAAPLSPAKGKKK
jgi:6-phosphofructokinase 1